jgi:pyridoxamine 5'-phosphate oxidase
VDASSLRKEYTSAGLDKADVDPDPIVQFQEWFEKVIDADLHEPNAMILATATADGKPSARTVLLKGYDERGFVFYTNYEGRKAVELESNPRAALVFYWGELERQVRVEGTVSRVSVEESDEYFASRPRVRQCEGQRLSKSGEEGFAGAKCNGIDDYLNRVDEPGARKLCHNAGAPQDRHI